MKKFILLIMTMAIALSLVGCGGEKTSEPEQSTDRGEESTTTSSKNEDSVEEIEFVIRTFGNITMNVPNVFDEVIEMEGEMDGLYASPGPDSSIIVSSVKEVDLLPSDWDESVAAEIVDTHYNATYTDLELAAFEGDINMNGNQAIYYAFFGKNDSGQERLVQMVRLYNADLTGMYIITLMHSVDDEFFTPEISLEIINSITLSAEAQSLTVESEE